MLVEFPALRIRRGLQAQYGAAMECGDAEVRSSQRHGLAEQARRQREDPGPGGILDPGNGTSPSDPERALAVGHQHLGAGADPQVFRFDAIGQGLGSVWYAAAGCFVESGAAC